MIDEGLDNAVLQPLSNLLLTHWITDSVQRICNSTTSMVRNSWWHAPYTYFPIWETRSRTCNPSPAGAFSSSCFRRSWLRWHIQFRLQTNRLRPFVKKLLVSSFSNYNSSVHSSSAASFCSSSPTYSASSSLTTPQAARIDEARPLTFKVWVRSFNLWTTWVTFVSIIVA